MLKSGDHWTKSPQYPEMHLLRPDNREADERGRRFSTSAIPFVAEKGYIDNDAVLLKREGQVRLVSNAICLSSTTGIASPNARVAAAANSPISCAGTVQDSWRLRNNSLAAPQIARILCHVVATTRLVERRFRSKSWHVHFIQL